LVPPGVLEVALRVLNLPGLEVGLGTTGVAFGSTPALANNCDCILATLEPIAAPVPVLVLEIEGDGIGVVVADPTRSSFFTVLALAARAIEGLCTGLSNVAFLGVNCLSDGLSTDLSTGFSTGVLAAGAAVVLGVGFGVAVVGAKVP